jgi:pimeloyl-ACP methyl ester carboxylesterase
VPHLRRLIATAAAGGALLLVASCTATISGHPSVATGSNLPSGPTTPAGQPIRFNDCTDGFTSVLPDRSGITGKVRIECGRLSVPLDYAHPGNGKIALSVVRVHDTDDTAPISDLQFNPGGPGESAIRSLFTTLLPEIPLAVLKKFDLVAADPRGVGFSSPLRCLSDARKDKFLAESSPDLSTALGLQRAKREELRLARACSNAAGPALPFVSTEYAARDMDQLRQGLGDKAMTYLGFSYGTELGWTYVNLFPSKVRAVVLDGAVDPDTSGIKQDAEQLQGFEDAFDQFAQNCRQTSPCNQLGNPRAAVHQIALSARTHPLATSSARPLTESLAINGVLAAMYSKSAWPILGQALVSARRGDGSGLLRLSDLLNDRSPDGSYTNLLDANIAYNCNDSAPKLPDNDTLHRIAAQWTRKFPLFGRQSESELVSCFGWQPHRTVVARPHAASANKVLVVGNLHDPATPYQGARDLARELGNAELLSWNGEGHTSYLSGSSCIDSYVNDYLISTTLPPENTTCQK